MAILETVEDLEVEDSEVAIEGAAVEVEEEVAEVVEVVQMVSVIITVVVHGVIQMVIQTSTMMEVGVMPAIVMETTLDLIEEEEEGEVAGVEEEAVVEEVEVKMEDLEKKMIAGEVIEMVTDPEVAAGEVEEEAPVEDLAIQVKIHFFFLFCLT